MSLSKQIKELTDALAEQTARVGTLEADIAAAAESHQAQVAEMQQRLDESDAIAVQRGVDIEAAIADRDAAVESASGAQEDLAACKSALAHPAHADAATAGLTEPIEGGGDVAALPAESDSHYKAYRQLQADGKFAEATEYWNKHEADIRKGE